MARIWSDEGRLAAWLEVELAATGAWSELGVVPVDAAQAIAEHASAPSPERVAELEAVLHHDTAAFVDAVSEQLGPEGRWFHYGLTSSDVVDTGLSLQVREAGRLILDGIERAFAAVVARAEEPFWPCPNGSCTSETSVRARCRISSANESSDDATTASAASSSACRSRWRICVDVGAGSSPSRSHVSRSSSGSVAA